jgi:hypothetical protein
MIPKPKREGERPLGIPTVRDSVIKTTTKIVREPIFEADLRRRPAVCRTSLPPLTRRFPSSSVPR